MIPPAIGLLGLGYLGEELLKNYSWSPNSWATKKPEIELSSASFESKIKIINFDWLSPTDRHNLPSPSVTLILTIPPALEDRLPERERVKNWCAWMNKSRHGCQKMVYISSVGVYPNQNGQWSEESKFEPDSLKGLLRLDTENILRRHFQLRVIRAGAIYGEKRHIGRRVLRQKLIPSGDSPVHRVHVSDLAQIVKMAVTEKSFPPAINAVDLDPSPSAAVVDWLTKRNFFPGKQFGGNYKEGYRARKHKEPAPKRFISNHLLVNKCKYRFLYPTYREGLKQILRRDFNIKKG